MAASNVGRRRDGATKGSSNSSRHARTADAQRRDRPSPAESMGTTAEAATAAPSTTTPGGSGIGPLLLLGGSDAMRTGNAASSARSSGSGSGSRSSPNQQQRDEEEEDASMNEDEEDEDDDEEEEEEDVDDDELPSFDLETFNAMCFPHGIDASLEANNLALPTFNNGDSDPRRAVASGTEVVEASSSSMADDASLMLSFMPGGDGLARLISFLTQVLGSNQDLEAEDQQNLKNFCRKLMVKMYGPDAAPDMEEGDHDLTSLLQTLMAQQQKLQANDRVSADKSNTQIRGPAAPASHRPAPKSRRTHPGAQHQSTSAASLPQILALEAGPSNLGSNASAAPSPASWSHLINPSSSPPAFPFLAMNFDQDEDEEADPDFDPFSIDPDFDLDASLRQMGMTRANMDEINSIMFATGTSPAFPQQRASSAAPTPADVERAAATAMSAAASKQARGTKRRAAETTKSSRSKAKEKGKQAALSNAEATGALSDSGTQDENSPAKKARGRPRKYDTVEEAREVKNLKRSRARAEERLKQEEADKLEKRNKHLESKMMELTAENKVLRREVAMLRVENAEIRAHKIATTLTNNNLRRGKSRASSADGSDSGASEMSDRSEHSSGEDLGSGAEDEDDGDEEQDEDCRDGADGEADRTAPEGHDNESPNDKQLRIALQRQASSDLRASLSVDNCYQSATRPPPAEEQTFGHDSAARMTLESLQHTTARTDKLLASSRVRSPAYAASSPMVMSWNGSAATGMSAGSPMISASSPSGLSPERVRAKDSLYALATGNSRLAASELREQHRQNDSSHEQQGQLRHLQQQRYPASGFRDAARNITDQASRLQLPEGLRAILAAAQQQQQQQQQQAQQQQQRMQA